jgi:hypothetical protein
MTQKYALLHEDGTVRGFLSDDVHDEIPAEAVPISDAVWSEWIGHTGTRRWIDGQLQAFAPPPVETPPAATISKAELLARIEALVALAQSLPDDAA